MAGRILADIVVTGAEPIGLNREHELVLPINCALQSPGLRWVLANCPQVQITTEALGAVGNDKKYTLAAVFTDAEEVQAFDDAKCAAFPCTTTATRLTPQPRQHFTTDGQH